MILIHGDVTIVFNTMRVNGVISRTVNTILVNGVMSRTFWGVTQAQNQAETAMGEAPTIET